MHGPEVESFDMAADPVQAVLGAQVVQSALPAGIVVEALPGQGVVVDEKRGPDTGQVEARVPVAANLRVGEIRFRYIESTWDRLRAIK